MFYTKYLLLSYYVDEVSTLITRKLSAIYEEKYSYETLNPGQIFL